MNDGVKLQQQQCTHASRGIQIPGRHFLLLLLPHPNLTILPESHLLNLFFFAECLEGLKFSSFLQFCSAKPWRETGKNGNKMKQERSKQPQTHSGSN